MARKAKPDEPKKHRSRKKKHEAPTPAAAAPAEATAPQPVAEPPAIAEPPAATPPAEPTQQQPEAELQGAKPRKSGRRAWDINLRGPGHTWERVETPDQFLVFRFKDPPTRGSSI